jgi:glycogen operon protein
MLLHGDELGRTQQGNNNTYAQDGPISWIDWANADPDLIQFTTDLITLRRQHPTFRRQRYFDGRSVRRGEGDPLPDIVWLTPEGDAMQPEEWDSGFGRTIGMFLNGNGIHGRDARGGRIVDVNFVLYFNAHDDTVAFTLPADEYAEQWEVVIDSTRAPKPAEPLPASSVLPVAARSMIVLRAFEEEAR